MKRPAELRPLSDDHHRALVLAKRARTAAEDGSRDTVNALWQDIRTEYTAHLAPHFAVEEAFLLPAVDRAGGAALAARTREDHRALHRLIRTGPFDEDTLADFGKLLFDHVRFEERTLFPFAEAHLSKNDLDAVRRESAALS